MLEDSLRDRPADGKDGSPAEETIQVTEEMIEAGVAELREKLFGQQLREIVTDVYWAMRSASNTSSRI